MLFPSIVFADAMIVCTNLTGTYAEVERPETALLTVTFTNGSFLVTDPTAKKNIVNVIPTEQGLVFVEDQKDRNRFRLSRISGTDEYMVEDQGKEGNPAADRRRTRRLIRLGTRDATEDAGQNKAD